MRVALFREQHNRRSEPESWSGADSFIFLEGGWLQLDQEVGGQDFEVDQKVGV